MLRYAGNKYLLPINDEINNFAKVPDCTGICSPKTHDLKISLASLGYLKLNYTLTKLPHFITVILY